MKSVRSSSVWATVWGLLPILALPAVAEATEREIVALYEIDLTVDGAVGEGPPWVKLRSKAPERVIRRGESARLDADGTYFLDLSESRPPTDSPDETHLAATFLVDFDEPPLQEILAQLPETASPDVAEQIERLTRRADRAIPQKTSLRDWDAASVAVRRGEGDCTEHAVVLAALARGRGLPARVVIGTLVAVFPHDAEGAGPRVRAFGHAWTEIYDGSVWRRADAAQLLPEAESDAGADPAAAAPPRLYYVPLALVEKEGPGYGLPLINLTIQTHPSSIVVGWGEPPTS